MVALIVFSYLIWFAGFFINGFTLYQTLTVIPTSMFAVKKLGLFCKFSNIVTCEVVFIIFSALWRWLFKSFILSSFLLTILTRLIFLGIALYDEKCYVYVSKESKKG